VAPACDLLHQDLRDELFPKEKSELFALEEVGQEGVLAGNRGKNSSSPRLFLQQALTIEGEMESNR
jgi:hypothetical protein